MHEVLAGYVDRGEVPGLVALVSRRGEIRVDAIGSMASETAKAMRRDTIFRVASMTKPVIAAAAMMLVEEGKIRLDDSVDHWLPELAGGRVLRRLDAPIDDTVPAKRPITVRDLLTFTLGTGLVFAMPGTYPIQDAIDKAGMGPGAPNPSRQPAPDEWLRRLATLPLVYQPGEVWMYNTGSEVLSVLIARAAGQPLDEFLRARIFEALGMHDTGFWVPAAGLDRFATSYELDRNLGILAVYDRPDDKWSRPPAFPSGAGGLVSTADDFHAFAQLLLNKGVHGSTRILSRPSVETMTMDHLTPAQKAGTVWLPGYFDTHGWGFGLSVVTQRYDIASTPGKYGWDGGLGTSWYSDPAEEMTTILLTQVAFTSPAPPDVLRDFWTLAYAAIED